jgi:hypothetical protein
MSKESFVAKIPIVFDRLSTLSLISFRISALGLMILNTL